MTPTEKAWSAAVRPGVVLANVERRLVSAGALTELRQLQGLSASEVDVLLWLELHEPICASGSPQGSSETVAA